MARDTAINPTGGCADRATTGTGAAIGQLTSAVWSHGKHELGKFDQRCCWASIAGTQHEPRTGVPSPRTCTGWAVSQFLEELQRVYR
jgi:hypothetical protein